MSELNPARVQSALKTVPKWEKQAANIRRSYSFKDFPAAIRFVNLVAGLAEVGSSRVDLQACKLEYSIVSPK